VFAHIHSPHPPFVLPEDAAAAPVPCFPTSCSLWATTLDELGIPFNDYRERLERQLNELNRQVLDAVRRIVSADPEAVVILLSDHGIRYSLSDRDEQFRSFLAVRAPGISSALPEDEAPVNLLRWLANTYWGAELPPLPYRAWYSDWSSTLDLEEIAPTPR
jgi:hypothetical protein